MAEKKKTTVAKSAKSAKNAGGAAATSRTSVAAGEPAPSSAQDQLAAFEGAMRLFHARNLREARELFHLASQGPERDVANRSRQHLAMCDRRLHQSPVNLDSAEENYNYAIAVLNTRNAAEARAHLEKALQMSPEADHILYALALAQAMSGDFAAAYENLRRSIELEPRNRILARQDTDFAHLANQPPFDSLLYPEKKGW